jgi:hypothetical protein
VARIVVKGLVEALDLGARTFEHLGKIGIAESSLSFFRPEAAYSLRCFIGLPPITQSGHHGPGHALDECEGQATTMRCLAY